MCIYGFAVVDRLETRKGIAVWITRRLGLNVFHGNAVVFEAGDDGDALAGLQALIRDSFVVVTPGSDLAGAPTEVTPLCVRDLASVLDDSDALQQEIESAIAEFSRRPDLRTGREVRKHRKLVQPDFPRRPELDLVLAPEEAPQLRALKTANLVKEIWSYWLMTEDERRKRVAGPRGESPWMMPPDLSSPEFRPFPPYLSRLRELSHTENPLTGRGRRTLTPAGE